MEGPHPEPGLTAPGLIETMRLEGGAIALWPWHRARLAASARALGYPLEESRLDAWLTARVDTLSASGGCALRLRLVLSPDGGLSLESSTLPPTTEPVRIVLAQDALGDDADGAVLRADPFWLCHKTTHRPWFAAAHRWLGEHPDCFDLIFLNAAGDLCEGSRCNIYVQGEGDVWLTPPAAGGLLPGVLRQTLIQRGIAREARLSLNDFRLAPQRRVSNALRGWLQAAWSRHP